MTEKQMNKLADLVADRVIEKLEKKQAEWDKEFQLGMQNMTMDSTLPIDISYSIKPLSTRELIEKQLDTLLDELAKALEIEDFEKCKILNEKIVVLNKKLLDL